MKPTLVILHGANGSAAEIAPLAKGLTARFQIHIPDLLGHGGRPVPNGYTLAEMADDLLAWLDRKRIGPAYLLGYSLGGYLALYLARHHPERVRGVIAIAAKHVFDPNAVNHIAYLANPERLARPGNPRKAELEAIHGADKWVQVTNNSAALFRGFGEQASLGDDDLRAIATPALILFGDLDPLISVAEARRLETLLANARLGLFPGPAHPLRNVPLAGVTRAIVHFISDVEAAGFAPGAPIALGSTLVSGGLVPAPFSVKIGKDRRTN